MTPLSLRLTFSGQVLRQLKVLYHFFAVGLHITLKTKFFFIYLSAHIGSTAVKHIVSGVLSLVAEILVVLSNYSHN